MNFTAESNIFNSSLEDTALSKARITSLDSSNTDLSFTHTLFPFVTHSLSTLVSPLKQYPISCKRFDLRI